MKNVKFYMTPELKFIALMEEDILTASGDRVLWGIEEGNGNKDRFSEVFGL